MLLETLRSLSLCCVMLLLDELNRQAAAADAAAAAAAAAADARLDTHKDVVTDATKQDNQSASAATSNAVHSSLLADVYPCK